ncbi:MAG: hypothetical protein Q9182_000904 [Xanthomendoza sp. 2 TL-2023]
MEQFTDFRKVLSSLATKEINSFQSALEQELTRRVSTFEIVDTRYDTDCNLTGDEDHALKINGLQDEINGLRQQVIRLRELEEQVQQLQGNAAKEHKPSLNQPPSYANKVQGNDDRAVRNPSKSPPDDRYVVLEDVEKYRRQFVQCSMELERVKEARDLLEGKVRQWKLNCRRLQHQILGQRFGSNHVEHMESFPRPGSAPVVQSNRLLSPESYGMNRASDASVPSANRVNAISDITGASNAALAVHNHNDQDDTETSDESEHRLVTEHQPNSGRSPEDGNVDVRQSGSKGSDSSDVVCIRAEPVKGKRKRSPTKAARQPKLVKQEISWSSPVAQSAFSAAKAVQESMDLDEITGSIYTPRKDRRKRHQIYDADPLSHCIQRMPNAWPTSKRPADDRDQRLENHNGNLALSEDEKFTGDDVSEARDDAYYQRLGEEHAARLRKADKLKGAEERRTKQRRHNQRQLAKHQNTKHTESGALQRHSAGAQKQHGLTHILQPKDANVALPRTSDISWNKRRRTTDHGARYITILAEDGEGSMDAENELLEDGRQDDVVIRGTLAKAPAPSCMLDTDARQRRLDRLLQRPSPEKPRLDSRSNDAPFANVPSTFRPHATSSRQLPEASAPKTPGLSRDIRPSTRKSRTSPSTATAAFTPSNEFNYRSPFAQPSSGKGSKDRESLLRSRPLSHLALDDFKINPEQNQGYDYAFKEVVRKQDQRKCLPGCTRLDCCGKIFRQMAETGLFNIVHTHRPTASSQEDAETSMLQDYLGDDASRLKNMSTEERAETLLQAQTRILADHYSKHREVYAREPSPVGFWDVDMPNSQEAREMGRMAEIRNRQKVEERYREAMKRDGLWKFRDE